MNTYEQITPGAQRNGMIAYLMREENTDNSQDTPDQPVTEHTDEELSAEGYLPEIYFQLKSDNPADW